MKETKYKIGDRVLVRGGYHCHILDIKRGWLGGIKYVCKWSINYIDYDYSYEKVGIKRGWQILCKD
ncbi:MAG: hypothetical protein KDC72_08615 [Bacteroidetes bacterium]|nr:hypothetical protein [Bacteroidota bacterium]